MIRLRNAWLLGLVLCWTPAALAAEDLILADFEGKDYGTWKTTGNAFGPGPAQGTLGGQMPVSGFEGHGLANSFFGGDGATGTLTSPAFRIERRYLSFLIGGGGHPGTTCINLLVDGKVVRTATGINTQPGGSEDLDWADWDVAELVGQEAQLQIVDEASGPWGHINVDQILQGERRHSPASAEREMKVEHRWLHLPVKNKGRKCWMRLVVDGQFQREFEIELAEGKPDFWTYTDLGDYRGKTLRIEVDKLVDGSQGFSSIRQDDELPDATTIYHELYRPRFHFSPRRGWTNDPNGMVYYQGEYHLFFQHNPYGANWGNMTWGHAVSRDLIHWEELPDAIHPDELGTIFSGSAVVDEPNSAGFQTGAEKTLVAFYTAAGGDNRASREAKQPFTQAMAYSTDRGRTWTKYAKNPILPNITGGNRDPKVVWHAPSQQWVMALFLDGMHKYGLFGSPDLKRWTQLCDIPPFNDAECPDFFELPVDGDKQNTRWLFWGGSGNYLLGRFDGKTFTKESGPFAACYRAKDCPVQTFDYAAQTFSDIPAADGRRIQIAWMTGGKYPGMPFNQQMSIPREMTLRTTPEGIRLFIEPVREVATLRGKAYAWKDQEIVVGQNPLQPVNGEQADLVADLALGDAQQVGFAIRGHRVAYDVAKHELSAFGKTAPLDPIEGRIRLRILVDRTSVEVFANDGRVQMASCFLPDAADRSLAVFAEGGRAHAVSLEAYELRSIWMK